MNRSAKIYFHDEYAGLLIESDLGYEFAYDADYLTCKKSFAISKTLPLIVEPYRSKTLFPFFDGLIPEGWLLDIAEKNWKLQSRDRFGILLACCNDCIGAVSVRAF
jgi:serine/threonine-protein kinase HipA